jgi:carboxyl-terminal processing protease
MSVSQRLPVWVMLLNAALAFAVTVLGIKVWSLSAEGLPPRELTMLRLVCNQVVKEHVFEHERDVLVRRAIVGMVQGLDRYSEFVPPEAVKEFERDTTGRYEGIGITMVPRRSPITVLSLAAGGPAEQAGMQVGDEIVRIDGEDVEGLEASSVLEEARKRLLGKPGTRVTLSVRRESAARPLEIDVSRGAVQQMSVHWARLVDAEAGIGYVYVSAFQEHTIDEFDAALERLQVLAGGRLRGLVVDLRFNPGGLLDQCVSMTNRLLPGGTIVSLKRRNGEEVERREADPAKCTWPDLPVVVLVNGRSASASEVLAAALQDNGRARLVGVRTFGKGVVQSIYSWDGLDFRLKLTTSHFYTPSGRNIEGHLRRDHVNPSSGGVEPDEVVPVPGETERAISAGLNEIEIPERLRPAAEALAERLGLSLARPLGPDQDPQLAAAVTALKDAAPRQRPAEPVRPAYK